MRLTYKANYTKVSEFIRHYVESTNDLKFNLQLDCIDRSKSSIQQVEKQNESKNSAILKTDQSEKKKPEEDVKNEIDQDDKDGIKQHKIVVLSSENIHR